MIQNKLTMLAACAVTALHLRMPRPPASGEGGSCTSRTIQLLDSTARTILEDVEFEALKLENEGCEDIIASCECSANAAVSKTLW